MLVLLFGLTYFKKNQTKNSTHPPEAYIYAKTTPAASLLARWWFQPILAPKMHQAYLESFTEVANWLEKTHDV